MASSTMGATKVAANHEIEHEKIYCRINKLESKVDETNGYLRGVVESNEKIVAVNSKLISLLEKRDTTMWRVVCILAGITMLSLGALVYGAIGKDGLFSVRQILPDKMVAIPAQNDFDKQRRSSRI